MHAFRDPSLRRAVAGPGPKLTTGRGFRFPAPMAGLAAALLVALAAAAQPAPREARMAFL